MDLHVRGKSLGQDDQGDVGESAYPITLIIPITVIRTKDGNLWFAENFGNKIGRIMPSGTITEFPLPTASSHPYIPAGVV